MPDSSPSLLGNSRDGLVYTDGLLWWSEGESERTPTKAFQVTLVRPGYAIVKEVPV